MPWRRQTPSEVRAIFGSQHEADPFGTALHAALACLWCFFLSWPTTFTEWAILPLALCFLIRMITHHRVLGPLVWDPVTRLTIAWAAWLALSILWSENPARWADDLGGLRYALLVPMLWPVLDSRNLLIGALIAGILWGNGSQVVHALAVATDSSSPWARDPARISGWWDPVVAGSIVTASLGLLLGVAWNTLAPPPSVYHEPGAPLGHPRFKAVGIGVLIVATMVAIAATGTRGAFIAAAGLVLAFSVIIIVRLPRRARALAAIAVAAGLIGLVLPMLAVPAARARIDRAGEEVRRVFAEGDFNTDTGARLLMWREAAYAVLAHPIGGVGAGGYQAWALDRLRTAGASEGSGGPSQRPRRKQAEFPIHSHAHSMWLHAAATTGLVGAAILFSLIARSVISGLRRAGRDHPGPALGLVGLALAGLFDSVHINQQTAALMWTLIALCSTMRPFDPSRREPTPRTPGAAA